jgi:membrane-bound serine protease (ClpP class)
MRCHGRFIVCGTGRAILFVIAVLASSIVPGHAQPVSPAGAGPVLVVEVKGVIGVAASAYIARGLEQAAQRDAVLVVLRLDTPGGLVSSTRDIIESILSSRVPVAVYVAPSGSRAASAGTYILYAAHVAAMAPGTHLGAATPVSLGPPPGMPGNERPAERDKQDDRSGGRPAPPSSAMERKVLNDAAAYIRALAQLRGRNADFAEKAVREAATLTANEARDAKVIDVLAAGLPDLLAAVDGRKVNAAGLERTLATSGARVETLAPDWRTRVIAAITDPNVAYLLLIVGFYGIIFEIWNPGMVFPGVIGGISLLLALAALAVLPVSYAGLALIVLGAGLMIAEAFTPGVGVLGLGGLVAFVAGSIFLFDPGDIGFEFGVAWPTIAAATATSAAFFFLVLGFAMKARHRPVVTGVEEMIGAGGHVLDWSGNAGRIRTHGEVWQARRAADTGPLAPGAPVRVVRLDGLTAIVEPAEAPPSSATRR